MKSLIVITLLALSSAAFAKPLTCVVSLMQAEHVRDFTMPSSDKGTFTQYGITNLEGISYFANQEKTDGSLHLMIIENGKTHLSTSSGPRHGKMDCLTIDFGKNEAAEEIKVAISCKG
ncbi:hypothetical protein CIK05_08965 [Bdellovibrio sp. qaytius]|nr:hypothetical protein CIK05_08965 [Bdellovibrio sp. qaytius]